MYGRFRDKLKTDEEMEELFVQAIHLVAAGRVLTVAILEPQAEYPCGLIEAVVHGRARGTAQQGAFHFRRADVGTGSGDLTPG